MANEEYFADNDMLGLFLDECCKELPVVKVERRALYSADQNHMHHHCEGSREFNKRMRARGFDETRTHGKVYWKGLCLIPRDADTKSSPF